MTLPINSRYPKWTFRIEDYWKIDDSERRNILHNYFLQCEVLGECDSVDEPLLTIEAMDLIINSDIMSSAMNVGSKAFQDRNNFHQLRRCVTAEALLLDGVEKEKITKKLVTHSSVPRVEANRQQRILELGGERMRYSCQLTPISKYYTESRLKKKEKRSLMRTIFAVISPLQKKRQLPAEEGDEVNAEDTTSREESILEECVKTSESEAIDGGQPTPGFFSRLLATPKAMLTGGLTPFKRRRDDEDNDEISKPKKLFHQFSPLSPQIDDGSVNQRSRRVAFKDNGAFEESLKSPMVFEEDITTADTATSPFQESRGRRVTDSFEESSSSNLETLSNDDDHAEEWWEQEYEGEQRVKFFDMEWEMAQKEAGLPRTTKVRKAKQAVALLHSLLNGDFDDLLDVFEEINKRLNHRKTPSTPPDQTSIAIVENIASFFETDQFQSNGRRDKFTQACLRAVWTSILGPKFGYCNVPCFGTNCPVISKKDDTYEIYLSSVNGTMYCHQSTIKKYECRKNEISRRKLNDIFNKKPNSTLYKDCQILRNSLECGKYPFQSIAESKKHWNNFDEEIEASVYGFCHDPEYVRPDNYSKQKYVCHDENGQHCKHQKHNWMTNGTKIDQYELWLESRWFQELLRSLNNLHPDKGINEEMLKAKVPMRKWKNFISNCVKPETRASCVDPKIAKAYDLARCLQMFFRGLLSQRTKQKNSLLQVNNANNIFYDPADENEEEDGDEEQDDEEEDSASLIEQFQRCACRWCGVEQGFLQIFKTLRGQSPHVELMNIMLCPRVPHPDLTMDGEPLFRLHKWECSEDECEECGSDVKLPFDCPVVKNSTYKVKVWVWDKATGDNERTMKQERMLKDIFADLKEALVDYAKHIVPLQMWNQMRHLAIARIINKPQTTFLLTDFSSQMDLEPIRKVNCHVNEHASIAIFVIFFQDSIMMDGEMTKFTACHEKYFFGGCKEKGKQNDFVMHNTALDSIIQDEEYINLSTGSLDLFSDNCPSQYKCRQNILQLAKKTIENPLMNSINHNFAKQYGFKNKCDSIGHWIKQGIAKNEVELDCHAHCALLACQFAHDYVRKRPSKLESLINKAREGSLPHDQRVKLKQLLNLKSPYETTCRSVAWIEDSKEEFEKLKKKVEDKKMPPMGVLFSDRARVKEEEDMAPLENITKYYSFRHDKADDNLKLADFVEKEPTANGEYICRYCPKSFTSDGKLFQGHQRFCRKAVEMGKSHLIKYKHFSCYCNKCADDEGQCQYHEYYGEEQSKQLISIRDTKLIKGVLLKEDTKSQKMKTVSILEEARNNFLTNYTSDVTYPDNFDIGSACRFKAVHWEYIVREACGITAERSDGKSGAITIKDNVRALKEGEGDWKAVLEKVEKRINELLDEEDEDIQIGVGMDELS